MRRLYVVPIAALQGASVSRLVRRACQVLQLQLSMNHWKKHKKARKRRAAELHYDAALFKDPPAFTLSGAARRGVVQGSPSEGGLSNLLPTNADKIAIVYLASIRHYIICADSRLCDCT